VLFFSFSIYIYPFVFRSALYQFSHGSHFENGKSYVGVSSVFVDSLIYRLVKGAKERKRGAVAKLYSLVSVAVKCEGRIFTLFEKNKISQGVGQERKLIV
jgi:hypothetical protein